MNLNLILILVTKLFFIASGLARPQRCSAPFYCATDSVQLQPIPDQTYSNDQFNLLQKVLKNLLYIMFQVNLRLQLFLQYRSAILQNV